MSWSGPRLYIASCTRHATRWNAFAESCDYNVLHITSTWHSNFVETTSPIVDGPGIWAKDFDDIEYQSNVMLVYQESGDRLRGALVEVGFALGINATKRRFPVIYCGDDEQAGTWAYANGVLRARSFADGIELAKRVHADWP